MSPVDLINAAFEGVGACLTALDVLRIRKDKQVKGVHWPTRAFWTVWGIWNIWYYSAVGHPFSFWAGAALAAVNGIWTAHAAWYSKPKTAPVQKIRRVK